MKKRSSRELGRIFDERWGDLATYNAEVARGIVHTTEHVALMAEKQARYYEARSDGTIWRPSPTEET